MAELAEFTADQARELTAAATVNHVTEKNRRYERMYAGVRDMVLTSIKNEATRGHNEFQFMVDGSSFSAHVDAAGGFKWFFDDLSWDDTTLWLLEHKCAIFSRLTVDLGKQGFEVTLDTSVTMLVASW